MPFNSKYSNNFSESSCESNIYRDILVVRTSICFLANWRWWSWSLSRSGQEYEDAIVHFSAGAREWARWCDVVASFIKSRSYRIISRWKKGINYCALKKFTIVTHNNILYSSQTTVMVLLDKIQIDFNAKCCKHFFFKDTKYSILKFSTLILSFFFPTLPWYCDVIICFLRRDWNRL